MEGGEELSGWVQWKERLDGEVRAFAVASTAMLCAIERVVEVSERSGPPPEGWVADIRGTRGVRMWWTCGVCGPGWGWRG